MLHLLQCISTIATTSSSEPIVFAGMVIDTTTQVLNAAFALIGLPIIVGAGVGVLYRVESHLRIYWWYLAIGFILNTAYWGWSLASGQICRTVVSREVQRMGTAFVCGFTDTFVFFWLLIGIIMSLYILYIVWSAAEEIKHGDYPALLRYRDAQKAASMPLPRKDIDDDPKDEEIKPFIKNVPKPAPMYGNVTPSMLNMHHLHAHGHVQHGMHHLSNAHPVGLPTMVPQAHPANHAPTLVPQSHPNPYAMPQSTPPAQVSQRSGGVPQSFVPTPASQSGP